MNIFRPQGHASVKVTPLNTQPERTQTGYLVGRHDGSKRPQMTPKRDERKGCLMGWFK